MTRCEILCETKVYYENVLKELLGSSNSGIAGKWLHEI